jgi:hypothetical protein
MSQIRTKPLRSSRNINQQLNIQTALKVSLLQDDFCVENRRFDVRQLLLPMFSLGQRWLIANRTSPHRSATTATWQSLPEQSDGR